MNTALIVAAGSGLRSELAVSKVLFKINNKPLFMYSVEVFKKMGYKIVLVVSKKDFDEIIKYTPDDVMVILGGKTRSESVKKGLSVIDTPYVYIHDAARPLIKEENIKMLEKALELHDAALLVEKVIPAIKRIENGNIYSENRDNYVLAQTPQAFLTEKIRYASTRNDDSYDDDISLYQAFYPDDNIFVIENNNPNPKLTYPKDFTQIKKSLEGYNMRIGHSFDLHQLVENRDLVLADIKIPYEKGLLGHSDADVILHAIAEAMLGALALGDLGKYFPDTDNRYKDIKSTEILKQVYKMIKNENYDIVNMDVMVFAEMPKLAPYIENMRKSISNILNIDISQISIKATTYEKMDAIGKGLAIAAEATILLKKV